MHALSTRFSKKTRDIEKRLVPRGEIAFKMATERGRFFSLDGIEINFCDEKNSQKASIKVLSRKLNLPAGDQSEHTDEHGCLQHGQIFLIKSEPLI